MLRTSLTHLDSSSFFPWICSVVSDISSMLLDLGSQMVLGATEEVRDGQSAVHGVATVIVP